MKKIIIIIVISVLIIGSVIALLIYNKKYGDKPITYPAKPDASTYTFYLINDQGDPTSAKKELLGNLRGIGSHYMHQIIWITNQPQSYPKNDPYDQGITYKTFDSLPQALGYIRTVINDSNWKQTTQQRLLFRSFQIPEEFSELITKLHRDSLITNDVFLPLGYAKGEQEKKKK